MHLQRLDPSNFPTTYVRAVSANGIVYFTDHVAKAEYDTFREQFAAILARYEELFEKFSLQKQNTVFALIYLDNAHGQDEADDLWSGWIGNIRAHATWVPSKFYTDRKVAITLFVATTEASAGAARSDATWQRDVNDMFTLSGAPTRLTLHNGVAYLTGTASMSGKPIEGQTREVLDTIDALMRRYQLKRENLVEHFSYVSDRPEVDIDAYEAQWKRWVGEDNHPPSGVRIQTHIDEGHDVEITLLFAVEDDYRMPAGTA